MHLHKELGPREMHPKFESGIDENSLYLTTLIPATRNDYVTRQETLI